MPMAALAAPTVRVASTIWGLPVRWAAAAAMNAAPPSWRVATTRMPAAGSVSSSGRKLSPGTVNANRAPAPARRSATSWATVG